MREYEKGFRDAVGELVKVMEWSLREDANPSESIDTLIHHLHTMSARRMDVEVGEGNVVKFTVIEGGIIQ